MTTDIGPLPKIHPREALVAGATRTILLAIMGATSDLTTAERLRVLSTVLAEEIGGIAKFAIRHERHGDTDTPGGAE